MKTILGIPEEYVASADNLPEGLQMVASEVESYLPGKGIFYALLLAQIFGGSHIYVRSIDKELLQRRDAAVHTELKAGVTSAMVAERFGMTRAEVEAMAAAG